MIRPLFRALLPAVSALLLTGATAAPYLSPQEAVKAMTVPPGFSVDLIAAEPDIVQPIAFCWDPKGRIWVVEGMTYPSRADSPPEEDYVKSISHLKLRDLKITVGQKEADAAGSIPQAVRAELEKAVAAEIPKIPESEFVFHPGPKRRADIKGGADRILIFEDSDGDGKFETRKVFAEGLNLVSGIELGFGGVFIGAAPYLLFLPDKDGDDKPDGEPEVLLDGWGYQDTHETLNNFIWGPDGWLYGCHGVFTHSNVGAPGTAQDKRTPINAGYWRYHPVRKVFEVFAHGTSNPWGLDYNDYGDWFSEACVIPHFWHIIQGGYYLRQSNPLGHFNPHVYTNIETIADHQHFIGDTPHAGNGKSDAAGGGHAHCGLCIYNGDNFPPEYRGRPMFFNIHGQRINQENLVPEGSGYVAKHLPDFLLANDPNFSGVALKVGPDGAVYFIDWYDRQKCHLTRKEVWDRSNGRIYRVKFNATWKPWKGDLSKEGAPPDEPSGWKRRMTRQVLMANKQLDENASHLAAMHLADAATETGKLELVFRYLSQGGFPSWNAIGATQNLPPSAVRWLGKAWPSGVISEHMPGPSTPVNRLNLASALQRMPHAERWPILEALLAHEEDAKDHNLPQMYWYAVEPLVAAEPERALALAEKSKIPLVSQHIARRLSSVDGGVGHLVTAMGKEKTAAGLIYLLKAAQDGMRGRTMAAPDAWEGAWKNMDDVLARRPDAKEYGPAVLDLRDALAVAFGDKRAFPGLRKAALDPALPVERRQNALQTLVQGNDPELGDLLLKLLDDPAMRLAALRALPSVK